MPIYEYRCPSCGHAFEELLKSASEERGLACPKCGGTKVEKQFSAFAAHDQSGSAPPMPPGPCGGCCGQDGACPLQ